MVKRSGKAGAVRHPDEWIFGKGMLVRFKEARPETCAWEPYELTGDDNLVLRVTLRIWGGSAGFLEFDSPDARRAYIDEDGRWATWLNAIRIAEMLCWTDLFDKEFVVFYCPKGQFDSAEELIRIYQRYGQASS